MQIVFWRFLKDQKPGYREMVWIDGNVMRRLRYDTYNERHLNYDIELHERKILPPSKRRGLTKPTVYSSPSNPQPEDLFP